MNTAHQAKRSVVLGSILTSAMALCLCGCSHAYSNAVASYATSASDGAESLVGIPSVAAGICRKQAMARYLQLRLEGAQASLETWDKYYEAPNSVSGKSSWKDYCGEIRATADGIAPLIGVLTTYFEALRSLAIQGAWYGSPSREPLTKLAAKPNPLTSLGRVIAGLEPPARELARFTESTYTDLTVHGLASPSDVHVQAILDGMLAYLATINTEVVEPAKQNRRLVLGLIENKTSLWTTPLEGDPIAGFAWYAQSVDDDIEDIESTFATYSALIHKLKAGHTLLATKPDEASSAVDINEAIADIRHAWERVEATVAASSSGS